MKTTYKQRVTSPFQVVQKKPFDVFDVTDQRHPAREVVRNNIGTFNLVASIEEDTHTLSSFKHVKGLISFICTLKKDEEIVGIGRGMAVLNPVNKYVTKSVQVAVNASLIDAVVRATKVLDILRGSTEQEEQQFQPITEKQKNYLQQLISTHVMDETEREERISRLDEFSRDEASDAIKSFVENR